MNIKKWKTASIIFSIIAGALLHFTYNLSGNNTFVSLFSSVNESTWEHLKLVFFPMLLITIIGYFIFGKNINNYISSKSIGILTAILFTIVFFYTYTGIIGTNYAILNILTFILAIILGENVALKLIESEKILDNRKYSWVILILFICFILFTFYPPKIELFNAPITNIHRTKELM